jgi:toxin CcdB
MPKYDVYRNVSGDGWLLDLQTDLLDIPNSRVVAPLTPATKYKKPATRLNPVFDVGVRRAVLLTQALSAIPKNALHEPVANLADRHREISDALDMVFNGF